MWELLTGDEPYADMHCASIIGKHQVRVKVLLLFVVLHYSCILIFEMRL